MSTVLTDLQPGFQRGDCGTPLPNCETHFKGMNHGHQKRDFSEDRRRGRRRCPVRSRRCRTRKQSGDGTRIGVKVATEGEPKGRDRT